MVALLTLLLLTACTPEDAASPTDPVAVGDQVAMRLTEAAILRSRGDTPGAVASWEAAHSAFEERLEARLRTACGDRCTTEIEYGFGRVRQAIDADARDAVDVADALGVRVQQAVAGLAPLEEAAP